MYKCNAPKSMLHGNFTFDNEDELCVPKQFLWKQSKPEAGVFDDGIRYLVGFTGNFPCDTGYLISEIKQLNVRLMAVGENGPLVGKVLKQCIL